MLQVTTFLFSFQQIILVCLAGAILAAPQNYNPRFGAGRYYNYKHIPIVSENRNGPTNGAYDYNFETGNGIRYQEQGVPSGPNGAVVSQGGWS